MPDRTMLVHLNVTVPEGDTRTADEMAHAILRILRNDRSDADEFPPPLGTSHLTMMIPLAEEI